jgi:hypothetical protein
MQKELQQLGEWITKLMSEPDRISEPDRSNEGSLIKSV